jgi:hypothetical protein
MVTDTLLVCHKEGLLYKGKLIYSGTRWCEHVLRMNKDRILKDVLHMKQKDRGQDESSRLQVAKMSCRRKETE